MVTLGASSFYCLFLLVVVFAEEELVVCFSALQVLCQSSWRATLLIHGLLAFLVRLRRSRVSFHEIRSCQLELALVEFIVLCC